MPTPRDWAMAFLRERKADAIAHPGGTLLDHLIRTEKLLRDSQAPEPVCLAGLCHAVALLSIANELHVLRNADLGSTAVAGVTGLIEQLRPYAPKAAADALTLL